MTHTTISILVADDHAVVRRGLQQMIAEEFELATVSETANGQGVLDRVRSQDIDLLVLDLNLPDKPGLEVLKEVKLLCPTLPVIILSLHPEEQYAIRALKAGAAGYLTKETAPEELLAALRKVLAGGKYVSARFAEYLAGNLAGDNATPALETLSDRELEVLCLIGQGKPPTEIANHLSLSVKTISTYRARILEKLGFNTTAELIRYAIDHNLVN